MSKLHTLKAGYTTRKGKTNPAVMVTMTEEERKTLYQYCSDIAKLKPQLQMDNLLTDWNEHDEYVIPGIADNVGPFHRGGRNKDITEKQLIKMCRALLKIKVVLKKMGKELPWCPVLTPENMDESEPMLNSQEVKRQMDRNRESDQRQKYLKENPDLIEDKLQSFKAVWPSYSKHKKKQSNNIY